MDEQGPDATGIDPWYVENLACPRDHGPLAFDGAALQCTAGHRYPVIDGLPVMLLDDVSQTMPLALASMSRARGEAGDGRVPGMYLESLGISDEEKAGIVDRVRAGTAAVDPVVSFLVGATSGYMYAHQIGKWTVYPIPSLRLPPGGGAPCSISAATGAAGRSRLHAPAMPSSESTRPWVPSWPRAAWLAAWGFRSGTWLVMLGSCPSGLVASIRRFPTASCST